MGSAQVGLTVDIPIAANWNYLPWTGEYFVDPGTRDLSYPDRIYCTQAGAYNIYVAMDFVPLVSLSFVRVGISNGAGASLGEQSFQNLVAGMIHPLLLYLPAKPLVVGEYIRVYLVPSNPSGPGGIVRGSRFPLPGLHPHGPHCPRFEVVGPL